jgi:hypothetical protein
VEREVSALEKELAELTALRPRFAEREPGAAPRSASVDGILALAAFVEAGLAARAPALRRLQGEQRTRREEVERLTHRIEERSSAVDPQLVRRAARIRLSEVPLGPIELEVDYRVPGARWAPTYELRLDPKAAAGRGALVLRAVVAQRTAEDWRGARLTLSTALPTASVELPELRSVRIGREQPPPPRAGWRSPPPGLEELFQPYEEALARRGRPPRSPGAAPAPSPSGGAAPLPPSAAATPAEAVVRPPRPPLGSVPGAPLPPAMAAAPMAMAAKRAVAAEGGGGAPSPAKRRHAAAPADHAVSGMAAPEAPLGDFDQEESTGSSALSPPRSGEPLPAAALLDYDGLELGGPDAGVQRGRLRVLTLGARLTTHVRLELWTDLLLFMHQTAASVADAPLPPGCVAAEAVERFDASYPCQAPADIPSTGEWVTVTVSTLEVETRTSYLTVPAVEPKVYRTLALANASSLPLLPGPLLVAAGDQLLLTTRLPALPPGGQSERMGLGVEEGIKVARHTHYRETTGGLLGGSLLLEHGVEVELTSALGVPVEVEVQERLPVAAEGERDIKLEEREVQPPWQAPTELVDGRLVEGLRRWRLTLAPGRRTPLVARYALRIPGDRMLVGGNRRS